MKRFNTKLVENKDICGNCITKSIVFFMNLDYKLFKLCQDSPLSNSFMGDRVGTDRPVLFPGCITELLPCIFMAFRSCKYM